MKIIIIIAIISINVLLFTGCSDKQPEPKVEYIFKTKIQYIYLPCRRETVPNTISVLGSNHLLPLTMNIKKVPAIKKKKQAIVKKYIEPKQTKIYAPKKYITRPNKKMDFMVGINKDGSEFIYMEGEFGTNTYSNFIEFLKKVDTNAKEVKINSNGGLVSTAMQIGTYVHDNKWDTGVDKEMHCYSACGFIYFAGKEKSLEGRAQVGLHRPYLPGVKDTAQSIKKMKRDYISYWNYIQAPKSIYDEMMEVDRGDLFILDKSNINDYIDVKIKEGS